MNKILVFGFPHCGTSILKSIIGHIDDVEEIVDETDRITNTSSKKYILCKYPYTLDEFFTPNNEYNNYIKIFIVRNPLFVFSSLNKRFQYKIPIKCSIESYVRTITKFNQCRNNPIKNLYTIRYEDLFENNYQKLKEIFDSIGLQYTDKTFDNSGYKNKIISNVMLMDHKPKNTEHDLYRTWQINQPFVNNNDCSKLDLRPEQKNKILNNKMIRLVYPEF
jgi:hypothetical protein